MCLVCVLIVRSMEACGPEWWNPRTMTRRASYSIAGGLFAVVIVFGLAVLMIIKGYGPEVVTPVVTGTSLAAGELMRRLQVLQVSMSASSEPERNARGHHESTTE
jgi:hypothetical protein